MGIEGGAPENALIVSVAFNRLTDVNTVIIFNEHTADHMSGFARAGRKTTLHICMLTRCCHARQTGGRP